ncbi:MAG TPA: DUF1176 domain-containing protein [Devosia sp.]
MRSFGDWSVQCLLDGFCSAMAHARDDSGSRFRIARHAEETYWEISFTPAVPASDPVQPFTFAVDDAVFTFSAFEDVAPYGNANDFFLLGTKAQGLMDALMPGQSVSITFTDETGTPTEATFSLNGLTSALMWIDGQQRRVGSERVAELPPVRLSPAFDLQNEPVLNLTTVRLTTVHNDRSGCSIRIDEESYDRVWPVALGQYETLFVVPCEDFAYNFVSALYLATDQGIAPAVLPSSDAAAGELGNTVYSPQWDEVSGELRSFYKGGNGNCGSAGRWTWNGEAFDLVELRARETCDDSTDEWPVVAGDSN